MRVLVGLLLTAGVAAAQVEPVANTQPGSQGWPGLSAPTVPPGVPSGGTVGSVNPPNTPIPQYPPAPAPILTEATPLPGSLADDLQREYAARQQFRTCDHYGGVTTVFPNTLLWEPPLASKIEPRTAVLIDSFKNSPGSSYTVDASIGTIFGLLRYTPDGRDAAYQLDLFGVVHTRLSPDDLLAADYRFGVPLTARWGSWHAKVGYEHTSAHLGDEYVRTRRVAPDKITAFSKDEAVVGLGRYLGDAFRVYGVVGYAQRQSLPDPDPPLVLAGTKSKWRYSVGAEYYDRTACGVAGTPFAAVNFDFRGDQDFKANSTVQAGWLIRNPFARLSSLRIYAEYYDGGSPYGQFHRDRESFYGIGFAGDY